MTTVTTQAELDAALADDTLTGEIWIDAAPGVGITLSDTRSKWVGVLGSTTIERATGNATIERATGNATIERATGNATIEWATGNATIERATGNATIKWADGNATIKWATGNATIKWADGNATIERADGNATIERADGNATIEWADGNATIEWATGNATIKWATGNATIKRADGTSIIHRLDGAATVPHAGSLVTVYLYSGRATVEGGRVVDLTQVDWTDVAMWCEFNGLDVEDGTAVVYKAVDGDLTSGHGVTYAVGGTVTAADWKRTNACGAGLHFGATPQHAAANAVGTVERYLACRIDVAESIAISGAGPADKVKAKSCVVLHEVDRFGDPVVKAAAAVGSP